MSGTITGGKKAAAKNIKNDPDFYRKIGRIGGRNGHTGGFASNPELARRAGAIGGRKSSRAGIRNGQGKNWVKANAES
jgi:general stress protein YciG